MSTVVYMRQYSVILKAKPKGVFNIVLCIHVYFNKALVGIVCILGI